VLSLPPYDAILILSFGGPEKRDDVVPFLENVLRGRPVPRERMLEVAEHYYHFDGRSPINEQVRALKAALEAVLEREGPRLPVYLGNRNWHPMLAETLRQMAFDGIRRALCFVTSAWSSYSSCRQYLDNIEEARRAVGPNAPIVEKIRPFFDHPGFLETVAQRVRNAFGRLTLADSEDAELIFTAHSIPVPMARTSRYESQVREASAIVAGMLGRSRYSVVWQSRSGAPGTPWLEPDINDYLRTLAASPDRPPAVVISPIGFLSDHLEVLWDLDVEARETCEQLDLPMVRAETVGHHPRFVAAIRDLIAERIENLPSRASLSTAGPCPDACDPACCPAPARSVSRVPPSG
jgi:protoporphyrin/coproporphyrin ferrochelatase